VQTDGYFENERPEIAELVPHEAGMILDVGCGKGKLGALLKQRSRQRKVFGIEYQPDMARMARKVLDGVQLGDLQRVAYEFKDGTFDCIICADVLEHLVEPAAVLRKLKPLLHRDGLIICSIPNMRHYTVLRQLILYGWEYAEYGLFDRTHLRFFSRASMIDLLSEGGFHIHKISPRIVATKKMRLLNFLLFGRLEEFLALQYLIIARPDFS
jgi:O-antigen biosynthesis protein